MSLFRSIVYRRIALLFLLLPLFAPAYAGAEPAARAPFMIIRFNQPRVYFDQQLYNAVARAVSLKPEVMFDLVANAPRTGNSDLDAKWQVVSKNNVNAVIVRLNAIGVPTSRLSVTTQAMDGLRYDEVQLFAR